MPNAVPCSSDATSHRKPDIDGPFSSILPTATEARTIKPRKGEKCNEREVWLEILYRVERMVWQWVWLTWNGKFPHFAQMLCQFSLTTLSPSRLKIKAQLYEPMSTQPNCQTASPTLYCTLQCPSLTGIAEISLIRAYLLLSELLQWVSDTYYVVNYS